MRKVYFLFLLYLFLTSTAFAGSVALPQTGQTQCYDTSGNAIECPGTGQDGESQAGVSWPSPRFTKNADTTITDNLTGLVWVPDGNIMPVQAPGWDPDGSILDGKVTWQHALDYVAKLNAENYLGHNDWRLPNVNELESLINAGEIDSSNWLNTQAQGFTNVKPDYYWSSTSYSNVTLYAWLVYMVDGYVDGYDKSPDDFYVWPLRAGQDNSSPAQLWKTGQTKCYDAAGTEINCPGTGQDGAMQTGVAWPSQRFVDHGDGTVTDNLTGLMWTKNANICCPNPLSGGIPWQDAQSLVSGMNAGSSENYGYTDWRIPNRVELHSLTDFSKSNPALISGHPFINVQVFYYWSSTIVVYDPQSAWYVDMFDGYIYWQMFNEVNGGYLWPVRTGQASGPGCSTWADVIGKYNSYVSGQAGWTDVISCYNGYASK